MPLMWSPVTTHQRRRQHPLPVVKGSIWLNDTEEKSTTVTHERSDGTNSNDRGQAVDNDQASETLEIMRTLAGILKKLEESQAKIEMK